MVGPKVNPVPTELQLVEASSPDSLNIFQLADGLAWLLFGLWGEIRVLGENHPPPMDKMLTET